MSAPGLKSAPGTCSGTHKVVERTQRSPAMKAQLRRRRRQQRRDRDRAVPRAVDGVDGSGHRHPGPQHLVDIPSCGRARILTLPSYVAENALSCRPQARARSPRCRRCARNGEGFGKTSSQGGAVAVRTDVVLAGQASGGPSSWWRPSRRARNLPARRRRIARKSSSFCRAVALPGESSNNGRSRAENDPSSVR